MAAATLNDVTNSLLMLNTEQGNTTEAVKSLVKRMQAMLDFDKRKALDDAEAAREAKNQARTQSQRTSAPSVSSPFGMGDALVAGALLSFFALNDEIRGFIDGVQDNLLKFVNDVQKIMFTLNQGLIRLGNFININIISRIRMLILDFRTNPKLINISTVIEESLDVLKGIIDRTTKVIINTFKVIGNAFRFIGTMLRVPLAFITNGVSEALLAVAKLNPVFNFFKGIGKIFSKLFLPLTIFITAWDTISGAVDGFKENGLVGGIEGAVTGFFNSLIFAPLDLLKEATKFVFNQVGLTSIADVIGDFSFQDTFTELVGAAVNLITGIFNLGNPDHPFRMGGFIEGLITQTVDIFAQIFNRFMNMLKSIPVVKEFFKSEEEKALEQKRKALEEEASRLKREIADLEDDKFMAGERKLLMQRRQGGAESVPLGFRTLGESMDSAIERRKAERDAALSAIQNLSARQLMKRMEGAQVAQMLALANRELSTMQSGITNTVVDNSTVAPNTTTVNNQMAVPTPAVETERFSLD